MVRQGQTRPPKEPQGVKGQHRRAAIPVKCREIPNNPYRALSKLVWCQNRRLDKGLLRSFTTRIIPWSRDPGRTTGTWLPGNLPGQHPWRQGTLAGSYWGKMGISSGKVVTAEAQGLCREASLSLTCPAALPPGNNKPLRSSCREFPLSSGLLWDQQLDLSLLFSLNTVFNHMPSSSHPLPWAASHSPDVTHTALTSLPVQMPLWKAHFSWNKPSHL